MRSNPSGQSSAWYFDRGWPVQGILWLIHRGIDYILYLRLRSFYWEGYIIRGARQLQDLNRPEVCWSCDLLKYYRMKFSESQLEMAKISLLKAFKNKYGELYGHIR